MKPVLALFLCFIILLPGVVKIGIVADYQFNRASIIKNFCVNKAKPAMHCDGKCYLKRKIKTQTEPNIPAALKVIEEILLYCQTSVITLPDAPVTNFRVFHFSPFLVVPYLAPLTNFLRPPAIF